MLSEIVTLGLRAQIVKGMPVLTNTKRSGLNVRENPDREYVAAIKKKKQQQQYCYYLLHRVYYYHFSSFSSWTYSQKQYSGYVL